ncbi:MAG TPA: hypothetical protein VNG32_03630 [Candidatus Dormibacteraeota bacterium]|nr:hypothetical protein [Candidatus Dormibacteraeota bacterium]
MLKYQIHLWCRTWPDIRNSCDCFRVFVPKKFTIKGNRGKLKKPDELKLELYFWQLSNQRD